MVRYLGYLAVISMVVLCGCASIIKGGSQKFEIVSTPPDAQVQIMDHTGKVVFGGNTPTTATLDKGVGYFKRNQFKVTITKDGFEPASVDLIAGVNAWYAAGNFVFGGLIGWLIVDPLTGAMFTYAPDKVDVTLKAKSSRNQDGSTALHISLLRDVPVEKWRSLVRIQ